MSLWQVLRPGSSSGSETQLSGQKDPVDKKHDHVDEFGKGGHNQQNLCGKDVAHHQRLIVKHRMDSQESGHKRSECYPPDQEVMER